MKKIVGCTNEQKADFRMTHEEIIAHFTENFDFSCDLFDKLFCNNLSSRGFKKNIKVFLNPWYEEIPIPETRTIRKSYISKLTVTFEEKIRSKFSILAHRMAFKITANLNLVIFRLENGLE